MASNALASFESNLTEVDRLFEFHRDAGGGDRGQRVGFEVINKSAIVLTCACWEAFIENLCIEAASQLTKQIQGPDNVPQSLRESCAEYLSSKKTWCILERSSFKLEAGSSSKREIASPRTE